MRWMSCLTPIILFIVSACADVEDHGEDYADDNHGISTTVILHFTPTTGGDTLSFVWADPENDGSPVVDDIALDYESEGDDNNALIYTLNIEILNELVDPVQEITPEIEASATEHQLFITGSSVSGPATIDNANAIIAHTYLDTDSNGLPVGLSNEITALDRGAGELIVTLRHMPPENDASVKIEGLAEEVAEAGFGAIGGDTDIQVSFTIEVN
jgi:hypothetical protein